MQDTDSVTPEVIGEENGLAVTFEPAVITADFEGMKKRIEQMLEPYGGMTEAGIEKMPLKDAKACRADLRAMSKSLNDGRKAVKKIYNEPLSEFEARIKELDALILAPAEQLDGVVKRREEEAKELRRQGLEATYRDFAPALVEVVPFERVLEPQWLNKSFNAAKAAEEMEAKVAKISSDWKQLKTLKLEFFAEDEAVFFRTLDLTQAIAHENERKEEQERINAMKSEVDGYAQEREQAAEPEEPQQPEPAKPEYQPEEKKNYVIHCSMTDGQRRELGAFFKSCSIHGTIGVEA